MRIADERRAVTIQPKQRERPGAGRGEVFDDRQCLREQVRSPEAAGRTGIIACAYA